MDRRRSRSARYRSRPAGRQDRVISLMRSLGRPVYFICLLALQLLLNFIRPAKRLAKAVTRLNPTVARFNLKIPRFPQLRLRPPAFPKFTLPSLFILVPLLTLLTLIFIAVDWLTDLPTPDDLKTHQPKLTTHIYDQSGRELYKIYKDENRSLVKLNELPRYVIDATVAIEDKEFWTHPGLSLIGISRAIGHDLRTLFQENPQERQLQGGSTITQQLVKNTLLTSERTYRRKLREVILAIRIERQYTKEEILEMYLNEVSYGGAAYGIQEAAAQYFHKDAKKLTLAEAALLAGLPAAPTAYSPLGASPPLAKVRQEEVLRLMVKEGYISQGQLEEALAQQLIFTDGITNIEAPHFVMYVRSLLVNKFGEELVNHGGLKVTTTLDLPLQQFVQQAVTQEVGRLTKLNVGNGAALVTKPATGEIVAMVGSINYFDYARDGQVNLTIRPRQPGSAIKPVMYAAALQQGFTPASVILDAPISFPQVASKPYTPINYDRKFHGPTPLRVALASSYNVPAVKVLSTIGVNNMIDQAEALGITTWEDRQRFGLALTLGGGEVTMLDMASVYGTFANMGMRAPLGPILRVEDSRGKVIYQNSVATRRAGATRALPATVAYQLTNILADPLARAPAFGTRSVLTIPGHEVAVKTGTTNNLRDNWTFGYTSDYVAAVWVGNNDNTPMSYIASGITGASPIWATIMKQLLKGRESVHTFTKPEELVSVFVCTLTGQLACDGCPSREELFIPGTQPTQTCKPETIQLIKEQQDESQQPDRNSRDRLLDGAAVER